jgi:hypothetical protein
MSVRFVVSLSLLAIVLLAPSGSHGVEVREERSNLIGAELGGRSLLGVGYERYLTNRIGVGAAVGLLVALSVSVIPVGDIHSLYLSANVVSDWDQSDSDGVLPGLTVAYQFQSETGLFVRAGITTIGWYPVPGVTIGRSF